MSPLLVDTPPPLINTLPALQTSVILTSLSHNHRPSTSSAGGGQAEANPANLEGDPIEAVDLAQSILANDVLLKLHKKVMEIVVSEVLSFFISDEAINIFC